ncbi:malto-oligosyltrehalose synthase [Ensifer soli]|uniref:malto-oligosyltrehalose synthase n=1 Tax=Ciceribacter sp. sgz301302 TaxID=3342379 RepID=UPI0035B945C5
MPDAPSSFPSSTYRVQFRNGVDFDAAIALLPHLTRLGISHLYASPIFTAVSGSTHGYDVVDANAVDPVLGGLTGFERLAEACLDAGIGIILDIVPNHMAASLENRWWYDVVKNGTESAYARHFDIDWSERLTLPFLGAPFAEEVEAGHVRLALDCDNRCLAFRCYDTLYPLTPASWPIALERLSDGIGAGDFALLRHDGAIAAGISALPEEARLRLDRAFERLSQDGDRMESIHLLQPYVLTSWRTARKNLSFRRFFEITGLVGVRVEDAAVFDDTHRLILDLVRRGLVGGLRVDHVDGLADPAAYLARLRREVGPEVWIGVEKILEQDEALPPDWPVEGTTGYEVITALADLLVDPAENGRLDAAFQTLRSEPRSHEAQIRACKERMLAENFEGEVARLARLGAAMAGDAGETLTDAEVAQAIRALIVDLPVYRTYATESGISAADRRLVDGIASTALRAANEEGEAAAIAFLQVILQHPVPGIHPGDLSRFRARFQQLSGPVMAKAVEDTFFYRHTGFLALNEVGGTPARPAGGVEAFHAFIERRAREMPAGLSATSTHDTKRGEDARARLYTLSEAPETWIDAVTRWTIMNSARVRGARRDLDTEWLLYQSLAGVWPVSGPPADTELPDLADRLKAFMIKALREGKEKSDWAAPDEEREIELGNRVLDMLSPGNEAFLADVDRTLRPFIRAGLVNSLAQTLVKLTAPGIPDIYNGAEGLDLSLVDPDNRRPVTPVATPATPPPLDDLRNVAAFKQWLISRVLPLRAGEKGDIFRGGYRRLSIEGDPIDGDGAAHAAAFLRQGDTGSAITIVPRLVLKGLAPGNGLRLDPDVFGDASLVLPADCRNAALRDVLTGKVWQGTATLRIRDLLSDHPVSLLLSQ